MKTTVMIAALGALMATATAAAAQEQDKTRTRSYEGENVSASQTTTVNRETGTVTRDGQVTNLNTGKTATSNAVRQRTETGATVDVVQTGPQGNSRSLNGERTRTENGSTFAGTATGRGGETYGLAGERSRDGQGNFNASQSVTNSAGETLAARQRSRTVSDGQVSSSISRSRAEGFKPRRATRAGRRRGN